ncbi:MAG: nuclear transport factor 2 family protein [Burkholderiales bacterium]|nr:nuclear transport factor 2 family protein [Burkholderiales bacterium]
MSTVAFPTPQDAESAFYEALEAGDFEAMMQVWAEDEEPVCVHPGGVRICGYEQVRQSWAQILSSGQRMKVRLSDAVRVQGMMVSVHNLHEFITVEGEAQESHPVATTNVYLRTGAGWRMVVHHASVVPQGVRPPERAVEAPKILH